MPSVPSHYYTALYKIAQAITSTLEPEAVLRQIVEGAAKAAGVKGCALMLLSPDRKVLLHAAACGLSDWYVRKGPVSVDVSMADALAGKAVEVVNAPEDPRVQYRPQAKKEGIASMLCVPVMLKGEVIGVMRLYTAEPRHFIEDDVYFLSAVANLGAIALENARLFEIIRRSDALRKRLFAITSHDLREPLVTVYSYLRAILDGFAGEIGAQLREMLEKVSRRVEELLELHSSILDMRGFDAQQVMKQREMVSPSELVVSCLESVRASAQEKEIALDNEVVAEPPPIYASANHLRRVLLNLLSNAIKFTPARGKIIVRLVPRKEHVQFDVFDNGGGISAEDLPHIFDEFYRGGGAPAKGLGLGLYLARKIVEAHGGTIWAESPYGAAGGCKGTKVSFICPRGEPDVPVTEQGKGG